MRNRRARHELYRFYGTQGELLYVGITGSVQQRTSKHRVTQPWWDLVATMTVQRFETRAESVLAERVAIRDEDPIFNISRPAPHAHAGFTPAINLCWVCREPVVEQLGDEYDDEVLTRDHVPCSEAVVEAYRRGRSDAQAGVVDG